MKVHINISLEPDVLGLARAKNINISGVCNEYLRQYLAIDETKLPDEKEELAEKRIELESELNITKQKLNVLEETERKKLQEKMERQQVREERIKKGEIEIIDENGS